MFFLWMFTEPLEDIKFLKEAFRERYGFHTIFVKFFWITIGVIMGPLLIMFSPMMGIERIAFLVILILFGTFASWVEVGLWDVVKSRYISGGDVLSLLYGVFWSGLIFGVYLLYLVTRNPMEIFPF